MSAHTLFYFRPHVKFELTHEGVDRLITDTFLPERIDDPHWAVFTRQGAPQIDVAAMAVNKTDGGWRPIVRARSRGGENAAIYARDGDDAVGLLIVATDRDAVTLVEVTLSPDRSVRGLRDPRRLGFETLP